MYASGTLWEAAAPAKLTSIHCQQVRTVERNYELDQPTTPSGISLLCR